MFEIRIPATTANLGPGFDSLGAALTMYATFTFKECDKVLEITGCDKKYRNKHNLIYTSYVKTFEIHGEKVKNVKIGVDSDIPLSRGLGSSAACVIGGVAGALYMMGKDIKKDNLLDISTVIEGHPDNVSPAIYGGLTASLKYGEKVFTEKYKVNDKIVFYAFIPNFSLATSDSRKALPKNVEFKDATFNISRIPLLLRGFEYNNKELLKVSIEDALHQPYRKGLIDEYDDVEKLCNECSGHAVYLSGAGPTIMCIADEPGNRASMEDQTAKFRNNWKVRELKIDEEGIQILRS